MKWAAAAALVALMPAIIFAPKPWSIIAAFIWAAYWFGSAAHSWMRLRECNRRIAEIDAKAARRAATIDAEQRR